MRSIEEIEAFLVLALSNDGTRLLSRGEARSLMRSAGVLPQGAPSFGGAIDVDLSEYGFALLDAALELRTLDASHAQLMPTLLRVGRTFEAIVKNGDPQSPARGFFRLLAAASYHLAGYAAMAFAVLKAIPADLLNLNQGEKALLQLILRDLKGMVASCRIWLSAPARRDDSIATQLATGDADLDEALAVIALDGLFRGLANFEFALRTGEQEYVSQASLLMDAARDLAGNVGLSTIWWVIRLARAFLDDLWSQSLHENIPRGPSDDGRWPAYKRMRRVYIASLFTLDIANVELWPSQIAAATRAVDPEDDLVVSLPTSAGKTRIAELATLECLSREKRVLLVTPLRALSAQTERVFRSRFAPLGFVVSSLYGKAGIAHGEDYALTKANIVVSTPEKIDFALRSDPHIIDDVGLVVLDEGHMIGKGEREVRFEALVQRLLRRGDADNRRIVCLSALLPSDHELDHMTSWIRADVPGEPIRSDWRPTLQRYGTIEWYRNSATLRYSLDNDGPFVPQFLQQVAARGRQRKPLPRGLQDATLMSAWRFAERGKKVLIFLTQANWVEAYAKALVDLVGRGYLGPLLHDHSRIARAEAIGREWLGEDHASVACLRAGVAVHNGRLPSPFLREVEQLLSSGDISVTISSPTLAQGLDLSAAVLLIPSLHRSGELIDGEELSNIAGRAGRAFVDTEGLVLHVIVDDHQRKKARWRKLVRRISVRKLRSGFAELLDQIIRRLSIEGLPLTADAFEYLASAREAWLGEAEEGDRLDRQERTSYLVAQLDGLILSLVEALDAGSDELPRLLDEALAGSLWARQLDAEDRQRHLLLLRARAGLIWSSTTPVQRVGHFAMGVGLDSGLALDHMSEILEITLDRADLAAFNGDLEGLCDAIVSLGDALLLVEPFIPNVQVEEDWGGILRRWLAGESMAGMVDQCVEFIEEALVYRLVWAMECLRVRRLARADRHPKSRWLVWRWRVWRPGCRTTGWRCWCGPACRREGRLNWLWRSRVLRLTISGA